MPVLLRWISVALLATTIGLAAGSRPPRHAIAPGELGRLILAAALLYGVGMAALLAGRATLGGAAVGGGVLVAALGGWLSRGLDAGDGPPCGEDERPTGPKPDPEGPAGFDWDRFDRERDGWEAGSRTRD